MHTKSAYTQLNNKIKYKKKKEARRQNLLLCTSAVFSQPKTTKWI